MPCEFCEAAMEHSHLCGKIQRLQSQADAKNDLRSALAKSDLQIVELKKQQEADLYTMGEIDRCRSEAFKRLDVANAQNRAMSMLLEQAACDFHLRHMKKGEDTTPETCDKEPCMKITKARAGTPLRDDRDLQIEELKADKEFQRRRAREAEDRGSGMERLNGVLRELADAARHFHTVWRSHPDLHKIWEDSEAGRRLDAAVNADKPKQEVCGATAGGYSCTQNKGHDGRHLARTRGGDGFQTWENDVVVKRLEVSGPKCEKCGEPISAHAYGCL